MPDVTRLGQAGLKGWREKVGQRAGATLARHTPLDED